MNTYAVTLRESLAESRTAGHSFEQAWQYALDTFPPGDHDPHYASNPSGGGCALLPQTREWMRRAYYRQPLPGPDYTMLEAALVEAVRDAADTSRTALSEARGRRGSPNGLCRWGGPSCAVDAVEGERFCDDHLAVLHGLRESGSQWGSRGEQGQRAAA